MTAYCSGLVLDVADGGCEPGTNVRQCTAFQNDAQKWILVKNDDGTMSIYSKRSKLALDVSWAIAENGTNVSTWTPNASASQKFTIDSDPAVLPDGIYSVKAFADRVRWSMWRAGLVLQMRTYICGRGMGPLRKNGK